MFIKDLINKYMKDDKKTVLYVTDNNTTFEFEKEGVGHKWDEAVDIYGERDGYITDSDGYVLEIACTEKKLWKAVGCNKNGEWAEFEKFLDENDYDADIRFRAEVEKEGFTVVALYRKSDVITKKMM